VRRVPGASARHSSGFVATREFGREVLGGLRFHVEREVLDHLADVAARTMKRLLESSHSMSEEQLDEIPSGELRWRVTGVHDSAWFVESGKQSVEDLNRALGLLGRSMRDFQRALDFGCGPGRILLQLEAVGGALELHGCDIDSEAVGWAQKHIPWARCVVSPPLPPTGFAAEFFDLVFNHSVFSHLDERYQDAWLAELARVTTPDGILLLSVNGEHAFADFEKSWREAGADPSPLKEKLISEGILYLVEDSWRGGPFPDFYHSTFHLPWYVFEHWGRFFEVKAYISRGALDFQDLALLQRRK
jgi:SAM-dependent methyltransferase